MSSSKVAGVRREAELARATAAAALSGLLERGEKLSVLLPRAEKLEATAGELEKSGRSVRRHAYWGKLEEWHRRRRRCHPSHRTRGGLRHRRTSLLRTQLPRQQPHLSRPPTLASLASPPDLS